MMKGKKAAERLINILPEWKAKRWNTEIQSLRSLESGLLASEKLVKDFDTAVEEKKKKVKEFF